MSGIASLFQASQTGGEVSPNHFSSNNNPTLIEKETIHKTEKGVTHRIPKNETNQLHMGGGSLTPSVNSPTNQTQITISLPSLNSRRSYFLDRPNGLAILGFNARSLKKNKVYLETLLYQYIYDVILVTETWIGPEETFNLENDQYSLIRSDDPTGYRGTALLFKKGLQMFSGNDMLPKDLQFPNLTLTKILLQGSVHLFLLVFYCPPKHPDAIDMLSKVDLVLEYLSKKYAKWSLFAYTDMNYDLKAHHTTAHCKRGERIFQLITKYELKVVVPMGQNFTWKHGCGRHAKTSFIDFFLTRCINNDGNPQVLPQPIGTSDHFPISISIRSDWIQPLMLSQHWCVSKLCAQKLVDSIVLPLIENYLTDQLSQTAKNNIPSSPLSKLKHIIKSLHKAYKPLKPIKYTSSFSYFDLIQKVNNGIISREDASHIMERYDCFKHTAMIKRFSELQMSNHMKDYYAHASAVLKLTTNSQNSLPINTLRDPRDPTRIITDPVELANVLTDHYKPIFEGASQPLTSSALPPIRLEPISIVELMDAIGLVKLNKAVSNDYLSDNLLKRIIQAQELNPHQLSPALQFVHLCLNQILNSNNNPKAELPAWISTSRMIFLPKDPFSDEPPTVENIRPITVSSVFVKCIEAVILRRLILPSSLNVPAQLSKSQIGFTGLLETSLHITRLAAILLEKQQERRGQTVQKSQEQGVLEDTYVVFIDFKSAFDKVHHERLFLKLLNYGVDCKTLSLIRLIFNSARVRILGELDSNKYEKILPKYPIKITRGTPQGSLISPILFNVYIDDLLKTLENNAMCVFAYADDICYLASSREEVEKNLRIVDDWCENNYMEISWKKTKVMKLLPRCSPSQPDSFKLYQGKLEFVAQYKYLGSILDNKMTLSQYILQIENKIKAFIINIPKVQQKMMSVHSRRHLWKTYADAYLTYGSSILAIQSVAMKK